ncbi:pyridoxamine 5'-phosphate oxidase [Marinitoga hydrogenitolerans DSM 16785]|uniref:Pyridoxamine 5'-phosphate oxidase n=1 Tax=Marinitoga hydrogenitolerans (strain DSM 16785 / JCM 12826 / AT1271) TaxID=1122195 RepID=A0A1M4WRR8_MARH1|nr:pyridoxamine 5'-phosphate oxidase family protein [Marinitoga hydrogenitolerans]SHE83743.1 pyridoxamine 5'-phosphate oxidase [Marinitoga hydrogenitolerans DSM 16785]
MDKKDVMKKLGKFLAETKTGVLGWINKDGYPELRWMSPCLMPYNTDCTYAITLEDFPKVNDLKNNGKVQWLIQNKSLTEVINIYGKINIIEDALFKSEVLENLSSNLVAIWKLEDDAEFVVLETIIEEIVYYDTMKGIKERINFREE